MKILISSLLISCIAFASFGQVDIDPALVDQGNFAPNLQEISIDKFEDAGFWRTLISIDDGVIQHRSLRGTPDAKDPLILETALAPQSSADDYVLGVRTDFFRRTYSTLSLVPARPIPIPGIASSLSIWVAGRNIPYELKILLRDSIGQISVLSFGKLQFLGWKKLETIIPPDIQDVRYTGLGRGLDSNTGLEVIGLQIESSLMETYGRYYVYFDDLRAVTDLTVLSRDPDDMIDNW